MIAKPAAFFLRDLRNAASYRLTFIISLGGLVFSLLTLQLTSRLVGEGRPAALEPFGNDYFTFALLGTGIALFSQAVAGSFPATIRNAQVTGTIEVLMGTRTTLAAFLLYSSLYAIAFAAIQLFGGMIVGQVVLGAHLRLDQALLASSILVLTTAIFAGIGIFGAAFVVRFKQREPITRLILTSSFLISGIIYPTAVLPDWLKPFAPLLPLTHAANALRATMLDGASSAHVTNDILTLAGFAVLFPLSLAAFSYSVHRAESRGIAVSILMLMLFRVSRQLAPEAQLLVQALAGDDPSSATGIHEALDRVENWDEVCTMSRRHRTTPWLLNAIKSSHAEDLVPAEVLSRLTSDARQRAFQSLGQGGALVEVSSEFEKAGIPSIVMKGPSVAEEFYPQASLRPYVDIDLLVPYDKRLAVQTICCRLGYTPYEGQGGPGSEREGTAEVAYETLYENSATGAKLDVHYDPLQIGLQPSDADGFWQRSEQWSFLGTKQYRPSLNDHFLMLSVHVHKHGFERLIWLKDLDLILRRSGSDLDWSWLKQRATEEGTLLSLGLALSVTRRLLGTPMPPEALKLTRGPAVMLAKLVWRDSTMFQTDLRLHPWRRTVQFIPQEGLRGALPSLLFMGRRREKLHSLATRLLHGANKASSEDDSAEPRPELAHNVRQHHHHH